MRRHPFKILSAAMGTALLLSACGSMEPTPYTQDELRKRVSDDKVRMYADQEPVTLPITFYEAAARALKYNLDYRLKLMESALATDLRDVASYEMLPRLVASAGYVGRNNDSGGTSIGIEDRQVSLRASTSEERDRNLAGLGLSWNLLDFGVAYYRTQQRADQILMANERRRKVAQNVLQDVRNAYWRALGAQRLLPEVDGLLARTHKALAAAREAETKGLLPRQDVLAYQRALIDSVYLLTVRRQDLEFAQAELAALISLPPGSKMVLADMAEPSMPAVTKDIDRLEQLSLENRPEVMEEWYRMRVDDYDLKVAKAQLWPNVGITLDSLYDSNKFLYNNSWNVIGVQVSFNLLKLLQMPSLNSAQANQTRTAEARRVALSMAVLTQVRVGYLRYQLARQEVEFADESLRVDRRLLEYAQSARTASVGTELELIRAEGRYLLSRYQREAAYASAQAAQGRLYNSVGFDVLPEAIDKSDIPSLAKDIEKKVQEHEQRSLIASAGTQGSGDVVARKN
ncbi:TolC family protein [Variovorax sp. J22P240]|uniref:TolC family protein n=1 Tax=unclassified Variovorax TaxID=663243 RepID=UPI0025769A42|nr:MULTISPECIES: TolC family protein [unclassified Variovorax]MDL9999411.1 TolC family protein [Variovorax sp. J22P240]MDM0052474.1 TolC family protein [Variovorax sp. J22R115]